jgi:hypothetical protein
MTRPAPRRILLLAVAAFDPTSMVRLRLAFPL